MEQAAHEFAWLLNKISGVESILEIGSRYGDSLRELAKVAKPGAKIRSIEIGTPNGECPNPTVKPMRKTVKDLKEQGYDADVFFSDSHDPEALEWAKQQGPFDFIYIDGDHTYEGAKKDWEWYGPLGKRVALKCISMVGTNEGVYKLWPEIRTKGCTNFGPRSVEFMSHKK